MSAEEFALERVGEAYGFVWAGYGYAIGFDQLHQERWGLVGEIHVRTAHALASTGRPGHMFSGIYNLSKLEDRDRLAKALGVRNDQVPWTDLLEVARAEATRLHRRGEPAVVLRDVVPLPVRYLIDPIVPADQTGVLYGDGASTKSTLARALALAVASGRAIGPIRPTCFGSVLILDYETEPEEWADGVRRLAAGAGLREVPARLHYRRQWRSLAQDQEAVRAEIARTGASYVVVDSLLGALDDDVAPSALSPFYNALRSFAGTTRTVITHVNRLDSHATKGLPDPYGSVFVKNYARSVWFLKREEGDDGVTFEVALVHRKVNRGPLHKPLGLRWSFTDPDGPIALAAADALDNPVLAAHGSIADRMEAALRHGSLDLAGLAEAAGVSEHSARTVVARLVQRGRLVRLSGGRGRGNVAFYGLLSANGGGA